MTSTTADLQAFARRIRLYFNPPLQDIAEEFALRIAQTAVLARKSCDLKRRWTILGWIGTDSLDRVEVMMSIEEELGFEISAEDAERSSVTTFRQVVIQIARHRQTRGCPRQMPDQ